LVSISARTRYAVIVLVALVTSMLAMSGGAQTQRAHADVSNTVLSGVLQTKNGSVMADAPVSLYVMADDPAGDGTFNVVVDRTITGPDGTFALTDNSVDMAPYQGTAGTVTLELSSLTHAGAVIDDFSARPPTTSAGWILTGLAPDGGDAGKMATVLTFRESEGLLLSKPWHAKATSLVAPGNDTLTAPAGEFGDDTEESYTDGLPPDDPKTGGQLLPGGGTYCGADTKWESTHDFKTNLVPVRYMKTLGRSSSKYLWDTREDAAFCRI
jgi:hypothetical protein